LEAIVDTNVLVYETIEDSMYHEEVVDRLERIDILYLPTNVMIEFILVMKKLGLTETFIVRKALEILREEKVKLTSIRDVDFREALKMIRQERVDIKRINDKLILAFSKRSRVPIYTYDRQLKTQAQTLGLKVFQLEQA